jgi:hypothetical protein
LVELRPVGLAVADTVRMSVPADAVLDRLGLEGE